MNILQKFKKYYKLVWYKINPISPELAYIRKELSRISETFDNSIELHMKQQNQVLADTMKNMYSEQSNHMHSELLHEINSQFGNMVDKMTDLMQSDIANLIKECRNFAQLSKEYIWEHQMDSASTELNKDLYNSYKWLETQYMPDFIRNRFARDSIERELKKIADRHQNKHIYILTDLPDCDYPYRVISLEQIKLYAKDPDALFVLLYQFDWNALGTVRYFESLGLKYQAPPQIAPMARYFHTNRYAYEVLMDERSNNPRTHYCPVDFENIFQCLEATKLLTGDYVEIGTYQGASARAALNYMHRTGIIRTSYFLDTYEGFTYAEAEQSSDAAWYGTHTETSLEMVKQYLSEYSNAHIIKSNIITNALPSAIKQIALCNIDVDILDAVYAALKKTAPLVVEHGIIIVEDYGHTPWLIGAQYAVKKFLKESEEFMPLYFPSGQIILIKTKTTN